ncbi:MAG: hypothetical protein H6841_11055 [Planctomycetes bacterium]|nr:hypothetical protein [Planctomycetota bacterium]MCB9936406.1 hypothetical protein [Planctomycetota bacterium]
MNIWVGIEVTRQVRMVGGKLQPAGELAVGGVNLLAHQIAIAKQLTPPEQVCILTPQGDEKVLELVAEHELRELAPFDFIAMLAERARAGEEGAVVLLRQVAPLRDATDVKRALELLSEHQLVISASKPPEGHRRHQPLPGESEPDYRCLAFEVRRLSQFSKQAMGEPGGEEELLFIVWDSFAEYTRPQDESETAQKMAKWV